MDCITTMTSWRVRIACLLFCFQLACLLGLSGLFGSVARAQEAAQEDSGVGGVLVSPTSYRLQQRAGRKDALQLTLADPGQVTSNTRLQVLPYLPEDWTYRPQYNVQHPRDASSWFAERDMNIVLAPGSKRELSLKFTVPPRISGSYWCVIQCNAKPLGSTTSASVIIDIPVLFTVGRVERPLIKLASPVMEKQWDAANAPLQLKFPIENNGEGYATTGVVSKLKNVATGSVVNSVEMSNITLFPGTKRFIQSRLPAALPDGNYAVEFRAQIGSRLLPAITSRYVVLKGEPQPETAASILELPPVTFEPRSISVSLPGGSSRSQALRISNISDREITIDIAARALEQTSSGILGLGSETLPAGLSAIVAPASITIRPKSVGTARVTVKAARAAQGDLWFGLAVTEHNNPNALSETINGTVTVAGTAKPQLEVVNGVVDIVSGQPLGVRFAVRNTGNQALQLVPSAAVLEGGLKLVSRLTVPVEGSGGILPGVELPNMTMLPPDLSPGEYIVEISYQYGEDLYAKLRVPIKVDKPVVKAAPPKATLPATPKAQAPKAAGKSQSAKPAAKPPQKLKPKSTTSTTRM
jgi:hypothetical protein